MSRHNFGTAIRRDINAQMLGKALAAPGMDQRYWCSFGTVCTIDPESGKMDPTDKLAIYNDSAGVDVDVELEPLGQPCTCKYAGVQAGDVTIMAPIRPGDIVLVECPDGDLFTPVITHIMQSRSKRQPTENGKPIFDNNRLLVYAKNVPIDVRTAGGAKLALQQDGTIEVSNESGADVQLKADGSVYVKTSTLITMEGAVPAVDFVAKGTAQNAQLVVAFGAIHDALNAIQGTLHSSGINLPDPLWTQYLQAIQGASDALPTTLSTIAKVGA
jgi:hypothetical protein